MSRKKRLRNWLKASHMLDKYDPMIFAVVTCADKEKFNKALIFRKSELEKYEKEYGERLKILF